VEKKFTDTYTISALFTKTFFAPSFEQKHNSQ